MRSWTELSQSLRVFLPTLRGVSMDVKLRNNFINNKYSFPYRLDISIKRNIGGSECWKYVGIGHAGTGL